MASGTPEQRVLTLFADLLEYPWPGLAETVRECETLVGSISAEAATWLGEFRTFAERTPPGKLEELYTGAFDLGMAYYPYVGYHLFGESYTRSVFLLELKERYRGHGFVVEKELPDHLAVLLRFLARNDDAGLAAELVHEALLPALDQMLDATPDEEGDQMAERSREQPPYREVLEALRLALQCQPSPGGAPGSSLPSIANDARQGKGGKSDA